MANPARKVLDDALALTPDERLEIAAELMASVDGASDPDWERAWAAELQRRVREADASGDRGESWDAVRARLFPRLDARAAR